ncbi:hypothetical protein VPH35_093084 [Triticum aestivum]
MGTSSESCKLQDEQYQYYKNLDDEKKYFLVLMLGDFQDAMIIPEEVVRRFKGEIPGEIKLETRNGYSHTIVVAKNQEKRVLTVGWRQFFTVMIFDSLGREKALSVVLAPFLPQVQDKRNEAHEIGYSQKMDVPRERRESRTEYHYTNLDDEKKYFMVLMMDDLQHEMVIPKEYVQRFKGEFPREMILETQNRRSYVIKVAENNGKSVLTVGWGKFVETFGLHMGDTLVFRYNGNSQFNVIIFDELGCEKASSVFVDPFPPPMQKRCTSTTDTVKSSHFHHEAIQTQPFSIGKGMPMESPRSQMEIDKPCQDNNTVIRDHVSSEEEYGVHEVSGSNCIVRKDRLFSCQKEQLKDGYMTVHKTKLTSAQKKVVKQKVQSIHSENPIFVAVMRKYNVASEFFLIFSKYYAKKYLGEERHMYLQLQGKKWEVQFRENSCGKRLGSGWKQFVKDNKLKTGDICLFELLSNERTMKVHIIHANDANYQADPQNDADRGGAPTHHTDGARDPDTSFASHR